MLIDEFLPTYDIAERHHVNMSVPVGEVYPAVRALDFRDSRITRWLFRVRGLPVPSSLTLDGLLSIGFILLGERPQQELLLGVVGRFWTLTGGIRRLDVAGFRDFRRQGFAKAAWNFSLFERGDGMTQLVTETRVHCLDDESRRRFRLYWLLIGPLSAFIRKEVLRGIKRKAERLDIAA